MSGCFSWRMVLSSPAALMSGGGAAARRCAAVPSEGPASDAARSDASFRSGVFNPDRNRITAGKATKYLGHHFLVPCWTLTGAHISTSQMGTLAFRTHRRHQIGHCQNAKFQASESVPQPRLSRRFLPVLSPTYACCCRVPSLQFCSNVRLPTASFTINPKAKR